MKSMLNIIFFVFVFITDIFAQKGNDPTIIFEETIFNFDTIIQGSDGEHHFWFTNEGDAPLLITSAFSSCGCVVPEWPKEPVAHNTKSNIKVKYNTNKLGHFTKVIVVKSNDPASPKTVLRINGVVVEPPKEQN